MLAPNSGNQRLGLRGEPGCGRIGHLRSAHDFDAGACCHAGSTRRQQVNEDGAVRSQDLGANVVCRNEHCE